MRNRLDHYRIEVDVTNGPGMRSLVDAFSDALEKMGYRETEYHVEVHGPPELTIGAVHRA